MQIHEITEGFFSNMARGFTSGVTGLDIPQSQASIDRQAARAADQLRAQGYGASDGDDDQPEVVRPQTSTIEKITVSLFSPGQENASRYTKTGQVWTNELGAVITDPKQKAYLDSMIPTHGKKEIVRVAQPEPAPEPKKAAAARRVSRRRKA